MIPTANFILLAMALLHGCASFERIPVSGRVGPYRIETTVDSTVARDYLREPKSRRASEFRRRYGERPIGVKELEEIANSTSVDYAAIFYARWLLTKPENAKIQKQFLEMLAKEKAKEKTRPGNPAAPTKKPLIVLVPGLNYVEFGHLTGADLAIPMKLAADAEIPALFVDVESLGSVDDNARYITEKLKTHLAAPSEIPEIIIAGASSAGPAIQVALSRLLPDRIRDRVKVWINLGGIVGGTPLIDWTDSWWRKPFWRLYLLFQGWSAEAFGSMKSSRRRADFESPRLPEHLKIINLMGLSLSGDISSTGMDQYRFMRGWGPNDGVTLLPYLLVAGAPTVIAPGSDHFFADDPDIAARASALLALAISHLDEI